MSACSHFGCDFDVFNGLFGANAFKAWWSLKKAQSGRASQENNTFLTQAFGEIRQRGFNSEMLKHAHL